MRKTVLIVGVFLAGLVFASSSSPVHAQEATAPEANKPKQVAAKKVIVEIQSGDSLSKIATKHETTYQRIFYANKSIEDPNIIHPGDKVRIPNKSEKLKKRELPVATAVVAKPAAQAPAQTTSTNYQPQASRQVSVPANAATGSVWDRLAACESGGNWAINTGNGYYGGLQFSAATWRSVGGAGLPHQASKAEQIKRGQILQARSGWGQWPSCTSMLGLR